MPYPMVLQGEEVQPNCGIFVCLCGRWVTDWYHGIVVLGGFQKAGFNILVPGNKGCIKKSP